jgi:FkbM family methyltransferase
MNDGRGDRLRRVLRNAFRSFGARRFGIRFTRDYLRFAYHAYRNWGSTAPGTMRLLGRRIAYPNQTHAVFLLHEVFVNGAYAFRAASRAPRVIDAGANIGMAVVFFKALYPDAVVTAYEPDPRTFATLERVVADNAITGVELVNAAVGEAQGTATLFTDETPSGSITASLDPAWGGSRSQQVRVVRLSDAIDGPVDFLKLDVEGAEYGVVRDLVETGRIAHVREAVIEFHAVASEPDGVSSMIRMLGAAGMTVTATADTGTRGSGLIHASRAAHAGAGMVRQNPAR